MVIVSERFFFAILPAISCVREELHRHTNTGMNNLTVGHLSLFFPNIILPLSGSQWPRGLRRRSAAVRLLRSWVRIPPGAWMSVCCECCVLSGRGLFDELITRPEESYWLWCVVLCDLETLRMRRPWPAWGHNATGGKKPFYWFRCSRNSLWGIPWPWTSTEGQCDGIIYNLYYCEYIHLTVWRQSSRLKWLCVYHTFASTSILGGV